MKIFSALFLITMLSLVSCGGKSGGGGGSTSGVFSNAVTTQEGYLDLNSQNLEFGGQIYTPQIVTQYQQNRQTILNAYNLARSRGVQPILINGSYKYRARMAAQLTNPYAYNTSGYTNGYPYTTSGSYGGVVGQNILVIQSIVFY